MTQRQKLDLARALIRACDFYIFNQPLLALDQRVQEQVVRNVFSLLDRAGRDPAIVWVLANPSLLDLFDRVAQFENGRLIHDTGVDAAVDDGRDYKEMAS